MVGVGYYLPKSLLPKSLLVRLHAGCLECGGNPHLETSYPIAARSKTALREGRGLLLLVQRSHWKADLGPLSGFAHISFV